MRYNADGIDKVLLSEVYDDFCLLDTREYTLKTPYEDLYRFCKYKNKSFDEFFELYLMRKSVWKDMDVFDKHMKNLIFRFLYLTSAFYKNERILRKQAKLYWKNENVRKSFSDAIVYYDIAKRYRNDEKFDVFYRLLKWNRLYLSFE